MIVNLWKKIFRQKCDFWENSVIKNSIYDRQHPVKKLTAGSWCSMREVWLFLCKKNQAFIGWSFFLGPAVPFQFFFMSTDFSVRQMYFSTVHIKPAWRMTLWDPTCPALTSWRGRCSSRGACWAPPRPSGWECTSCSTTTRTSCRMDSDEPGSCSKKYYFL